MKPMSPIEEARVRKVFSGRAFLPRAIESIALRHQCPSANPAATAAAEDEVLALIASAVAVLSPSALDGLLADALFPAELANFHPSLGAGAVRGPNAVHAAVRFDLPRALAALLALGAPAAAPVLGFSVVHVAALLDRAACAEVLLRGVAPEAWRDMCERSAAAGATDALEACIASFGRFVPTPVRHNALTAPLRYDAAQFAGATALATLSPPRSRPLALAASLGHAAVMAVLARPGVCAAVHRHLAFEQARGLLVAAVQGGSAECARLALRWGLRETAEPHRGPGRGLRDDVDNDDGDDEDGGDDDGDNGLAAEALIDRLTVQSVTEVARSTPSNAPDSCAALSHAASNHAASSNAALDVLRVAVPRAFADSDAAAALATERARQLRDEQRRAAALAKQFSHNADAEASQGLGAAVAALFSARVCSQGSGVLLAPAVAAAESAVQRALTQLAAGRLQCRSVVEEHGAQKLRDVVLAHTGETCMVIVTKTTVCEDDDDERAVLVETAVNADGNVADFVAVTLTDGFLEILEDYDSELDSSTESDSDPESDSDSDSGLEANSKTTSKHEHARATAPDESDPEQTPAPQTPAERVALYCDTGVRTSPMPAWLSQSALAPLDFGAVLFLVRTLLSARVFPPRSNHAKELRGLRELAEH